MKKAIVISYYWPPAGGAGVQRWLKFCKYLPDFGWTPIVYTPENPEYPVLDHSLLSDVGGDLQILRSPIWEPYQLFKKFTGRNSTDKVNNSLLLEGTSQSWKDQLSIWLRGNLAVPDPRVFWVKPSVRLLSEKIKDLKPDAIISTGTPHSMHLIAMALHRKFKIPWLADFRDPWSELDMYKKFNMTQWAYRRHRRLEYKVLTEASKVVTVSPSWAKDLERIGNREVTVIHNGYDTADLQSVAAEAEQKGVFRLSHLGMINAFRNPKQLWAALNELCEETSMFAEKFELNLVGTIDPEVRAAVNDFNHLRKRTFFTNYIPHAEVFNEYNRSSALLLLLNDSENAKGHLPGKLYEYLATKLPLLAIGLTNSDAADIMRTFDMSSIVEPFDREGVKKSIRSIFDSWTKGVRHRQEQGIDKFSRKTLTKKLANQLNSITS